MQVFRKTLTAGVEEVYTVDKAFQTMTILNVGSDDVYMNVNATATVDGADCVLIPPGMGRDFYFSYLVSDVHVISAGSPRVQIDTGR